MRGKDNPPEIQALLTFKINSLPKQQSLTRYPKKVTISCLNIPEYLNNISNNINLILVSRQIFSLSTISQITSIINNSHHTNHHNRHISSLLPVLGLKLRIHMLKTHSIKIHSMCPMNLLIFLPKCSHK